MERWLHQTRCVEQVQAAIQQGERRICVTAPTGAGKTVIMLDLAQSYLDQGKRVSLYTNRRMLVDQTSEVMLKAGIYHGIRAADYEDEREHNFQISSIQTENSRVLKRQRWELHKADLVLIDEAHQQTSPVARKIMARHQADGAAIVGMTATPIDLADCYDHLIVAATNSELRQCGALIAANHYGPDEPDLRKMKGLTEGEDMSENQQRKAMMTPTLWGRVWTWFERLNPERKPTILFAPGVKESVWFAEQFTKRGVPAAHIDGAEVWRNGEFYQSDREIRQDVLSASKAGNVVVLCNRFVLREGIDAPWLAHGILATVFGSLQSYLQSGGRLLRAYPGMENVTIQDHGGNWWRHGSLNEDRHWELAYTASMVYGLRAERMRRKDLPEPMRCPMCGRILNRSHCPCGYDLPAGKKSRPVVTQDGELVQMHGDVFRPRRISTQPNGPELWRKMYHRSRTTKGERTFRAAAALFAQENNWQWPDPRWPLMPTNEKDWFKHVADVPCDLLT